MHSSRMCTVRSSSRFGGGGSVPGGGVCSWGSALGGGSAPGGVVSQADPPQQIPPVDRMIDTCKKHNLRNFIADGN